MIRCSDCGYQNTLDASAREHALKSRGGRFPCVNCGMLQALPAPDVHLDTLAGAGIDPGPEPGHAGSGEYRRHGSAGSGGQRRRGVAGSGERRTLAAVDGNAEGTSRGTGLHRSASKETSELQVFGLSRREFKRFGVVLLASVLLALLVSMYLPLARFWLGLGIGFVGCLTAIVGNDLISRTAQRESGLRATICKFFPIYSIYYVSTRWKKMHDVSMLFRYGLATMIAGYLVCLGALQMTAPSTGERRRVTKGAPKQPARPFAISKAAGAVAAILHVRGERREGAAIEVVGTDGVKDEKSFGWAVFKGRAEAPFDTAEGLGMTAFRFRPDDNAAYRVVLTIDSSDRPEDKAEQMIEIDNVPPEPSIPLIDAVRQEGTAIHVRGMAVDPALDRDTLTYSWAVYKEGSEAAYKSGAGPDLTSFAFTPNDDAEYRVVLKVSDEDGGTGSAERIIEVENVAPSPDLSPPRGDAIEGLPLVFTGKATDPALEHDTLTYQWDVYRPGEEKPVASESGVRKTSYLFTPADDGTYLVDLTVSDEDGGSNTVEREVRVTNAAPRPSITPPDSAFKEGTTVRLAGTAIDPAGASDTLTYRWAVTKAGTKAPASARVGVGLTSFEFTPDDNSSYIVSLTVSDEDGGSATVEEVIGVVNVGPTATIVAPVSDPVVRVGTPVSFEGTFADDGRLDTHTARWLLTPAGAAPVIEVPAAVSESGGRGTARATRAIDAPGVYRVELAVSDKDQAQGRGARNRSGPVQVIAYDPAAGSLDGDGEFSSAAGSSPEDPTAAGPVRFRLAAAYEQDAAVPAGQIEVRFDAANSGFRSSKLDWLVVTPGLAQVRGSGAVAGVDGHEILVTAREGGPRGTVPVGGIRVKIWERASGRIVYDNGRGGPDDQAPTANLARGSIRIPRNSSR